jgi:hypothetical protein
MHNTADEETRKTISLHTTTQTQHKPLQFSLSPQQERIQERQSHYTLPQHFGDVVVGRGGRGRKQLKCSFECSLLLVFVLYVEEREGVWTVYCLYCLLLFRKFRERERERERD